MKPKIEKKYCPFINGLCRDDCVFKCCIVVTDEGALYNCLIAIKLIDISGMQHDDLMMILKQLKEN